MVAREKQNGHGVMARFTAGWSKNEPGLWEGGSPAAR